MSGTLAKLLTGDILDRVAYAPHNMAKVRLFYGVPPVPISGLDYVFATYDNPQTMLKMGLDGKGRYIQNRNLSGTIEFGIIDGSASNGIMQLALLTGIPYPIAIIDEQSAGTSFVAAGAATRVGTPEWRKELTVGMQVYTFKTAQLFMSTGIKKPE
jgi:hypothetical protein